jgi:putative ABC transport system ATP-binding protein
MRELGTTAVVITHNAAIAGMADRVIRTWWTARVQRIERNAHRLSPSELSW